MLSFSDYPTAERAFRFFEEISKIPHVSFHTDKLADYLEAFARERGLFCVRDKANNVLIRKGASAGYESHPTVVFQGHIDMVPEHLPEKKIDMETEPITLVRDGDFLRADGTTLGGDDGVAVAYALAILDDDSLAHPEFEALFTSEEEVGLLGATALDPTPIRGRVMINIDSDDEGVFTVGCAGGARVDLSLGACKESATGAAFRVKIGGLAGGHSGAEIDKGRENAILLLAHILVAVRARGSVRIASALGGNADNAIPRNAECVFFAEGVDLEEIDAICKESLTNIREKEPGATIKAEKVSDIKDAYSSSDTDRFLSLLSRVPNGVQAMSRAIAGLVETSLNLGVLDTENGFHITHSVRSSKEEEKDALIATLRRLATDVGGTASVRGEYPAWEYREDSPLRDLLCRLFREMYGKEAKVLVIHAGLECGILSSKLPGLDCVSLGPDNFDIHTTEEHLSIPSFVRVYEYLLRVLAAL
mgnify:CR=1 FL=1